MLPYFLSLGTPALAVRVSVAARVPTFWHSHVHQYSNYSEKALVGLMILLSQFKNLFRNYYIINNHLKGLLPYIVNIYVDITSHWCKNWRTLLVSLETVDMCTGTSDNRRTLSTSIRLNSLFVLDAIFGHFNILKCSFMFFSVYLLDLSMIHALHEFCL